MMQCHAIELLKGVHNLPGRRRKPRIHRYAFQFAGADIDASALLDVTEVDGVEGSALVGDHGWFHVAEKSPLSGLEERLGLDI